jgi:hypothetical protein
MKAKITRIAIFVVLLFVWTSAWTQDKAVAVVEFSNGDDFIVIRKGRKLANQDPIGLELFQGDQLQTGDNVFIELRIISGNAIVKLAENTTFVLEKLGDGQTSMQLVYGRIRAKVERLSGTETFSIRSTQAVAGVRGTDFGVDVVASRQAAQGSTVTNAYCFEGAVEVTAFVRSDALAAESLEAIPKTYVIGAGEMVKVEGAAGKAEAIKVPLEKAIQGFWKENDYVSIVDPKAVKPASAAPVPALTEAEERAVKDKAIRDKAYAEGYDVARKEFYKGPDYVPDGFVPVEELEKIRKASGSQRAGVIAGTMLGIGGAAFAVTGYYQLMTGDTDAGTSKLSTGALLSLTSLPFLVLSIISGP